MERVSDDGSYLSEENGEDVVTETTNGAKERKLQIGKKIPVKLLLLDHKGFMGWSSLSVRHTFQNVLCKSAITESRLKPPDASTNVAASNTCLYTLDVASEKPNRKNCGTQLEFIFCSRIFLTDI